MTATPRPRKRQRPSATSAPVRQPRPTPIPPTLSDLPANPAEFPTALHNLLSRLHAIRAHAVHLRDIHLRAAADIDEAHKTREAAARAVSRIRPRPSSSTSLQQHPSHSLNNLAEPLPPSSSLAASQHAPPIPAPSLPALKLVAEQPSSEKLIREQSIIIRAQAITRKNAELARERLPKQPEAQRAKTWRDYFTDETVWMATDFREERKWKITMARKLAKSVMQYHLQKAGREARAKFQQHQRTVKLANALARDVRKFWAQIREIADFRLSKADRLRRHHQSQVLLDKFLDRTQQYSKQLASNFHRSANPSDQQQPHPSPAPTRVGPVDDVHVKQVRFADADVPRSAQPPNGSAEPSLPTSSSSALDLNRDPAKPSPSANLSLPPGKPLGIKKDPPPNPGSAPIISAGKVKEPPDMNGRSLPTPLLHPSVTPNPSPLDAHDVSPAPSSSTKVVQLSNGAHENVVENGTCDRTHVERPASDLKVPSLSAGNADEQDASKQAVALPDPPRANGHHVTDGEENKLRQDHKDSPGKSDPIRMPVELLRGKLRDYQRSGMQWLINLYRSRSNGILADEMGLGKTIQTISLLAWLAIEHEIWGPHLIIVPTSVMVNWEVEFKKWLPGFKILTYFGSMKERKMKRKGWTDPDMFHVCITSYTLAVQDVHILRRKKWVYLILDEAHNIKNFKSQRWQTLLTLSSQQRLLLTGTPLQNSVMELWSLMHFLMPKLFESQTEFKDWFSNPLQDSDTGAERFKVVEKLHTALRPFLLRRLKADVEKGLPPKFEHVVKCHLGKRQRQLYEDFMARSDVMENLQSGDLFKVMNVLMQLRKVCNHPDLFEGRPIISPFAMSPLFYPVPSIAARLTEHTSADRLNRSLLGLDFCTKELTWPGKWVSEQSESLSLDNIARDLILQRRAADEKILSSDQDTLSQPALLAKQRAMAFKRASLYYLTVVSAHRIRERGLYGEDLRSACMMTPSSLLQSLRFNRQTHEQFLPSSCRNLVSDIETFAERAKAACEQFVCCVSKVAVPVVEMRYQGDDSYYSRSVQHSANFNKVTSSYRSLFRSYEVRSQVTIPDKRLVQWDCGKLQVLDLLLRRLRAKSSRALIFTQMTKVLDVLESFLNLHTYRYLRLDGTTKTDERQKVVQRFNSDKRIFCMILTTRAGGVGLNLTGADSVIFYDTDYNPAIDKQAQDRAHRIGQTKPVHVFRLVSEDTVEEAILQRANQKRSLETQIISEAGFTTEAIAEPKADTRDHMALPSPPNPAASADIVSNPPEIVQNGLTGSTENPSDPMEIENMEANPLTDGVASAQGNFRGFRCDIPADDSGLSKTQYSGSAGLGKLAGSDEFQRVSEKLLAGDDEREKVAMHAEEQERKDIEEEFDDVGVDSFGESEGARQRNSNDTDELDVQNTLTSIQRYALQLMEKRQNDDAHISDVASSEGGSDAECDAISDGTAHNDAESDGVELLRTAENVGENEENRRKSPNGTSGIERDPHLAMKTDDTPETQGVDDGHLETCDNSDDEMFYTLDVSEEGRHNYLKALTDTDVDIKLYLPLRDGGPEELKVSTVVCGTAAAGLECAEDAAFFPHAYNRMSRTEYATKRQKEKFLARLRRDPRRNESDNRSGPGSNRERYMGTSSRGSEAPLPSRGMNLVGIGSCGFPERTNDRNNRDAIVERSTGVTASRGTGNISNSAMPDIVRPVGVMSRASGDFSRGLGMGERTKVQKQKGDGARGASVAMKKVRGTGVTSGPGGIDSANSGLFKKQKKTTKKWQLGGVKGSSSSVANNAMATPIGRNEGWTREEDQQLIDISEQFGHNMLLVSDLLSSNMPVAIGLRQRRRADHCFQRLLKCLKERPGQASPVATNSDSDALLRHRNGFRSTLVNGSFSLLNGIALPPANEDTHPSQKRVVMEANSKKDLIAGNGALPTFPNVEKGIKVSKHYRPGLKSRETTPSAIRRKKVPYISPPREDRRATGGSGGLGSHFGSGVQVSGSGCDIVKTDRTGGVSGRLSSSDGLKSVSVGGVGVKVSNGRGTSSGPVGKVSVLGKGGVVGARGNAVTGAATTPTTVKVDLGAGGGGIENKVGSQVPGTGGTGVRKAVGAPQVVSAGRGRGTGTGALKVTSGIRKETKKVGMVSKNVGAVGVGRGNGIVMTGGGVGRASNVGGVGDRIGGSVGSGSGASKSGVGRGTGATGATGATGVGAGGVIGVGGRGWPISKTKGVSGRGGGVIKQRGSMTGGTNGTVGSVAVMAAGALKNGVGGKTVSGGGGGGGGGGGVGGMGLGGVSGKNGAAVGGGVGTTVGAGTVAGNVAGTVVGAGALTTKASGETTEVKKAVNEVNEGAG